MGMRRWWTDRSVRKQIERRERRFEEGDAALRSALKKFDNRPDMMNALSHLLAEQCSEDECEFFSSQFGRRAHNMHRSRMRTGLGSSKSEPEQGFPSQVYPDVEHV